MTTRSKIRPGDGDTRHGTVNGYSNLDCRCPECRAAWAAKCREMRENRTLAPGDARHGTLGGYTNYGCRCDECKAARRGPAEPRDLQPCGTRAAYRRGCRCKACRAANAAFVRQSRQRR